MSVIYTIKFPLCNLLLKSEKSLPFLNKRNIRDGLMITEGRDMNTRIRVYIQI